MVLAAATQQLSGFGFALMAVPALSVVIGPKDAIALAAVANAGGALLMAYRLRALADRQILRRLLIGACVGMPIGIVALRQLPDAPLQVLMAVVVFAAVGLLATGWRLSRESP